jgi:uncharacterized protein YkwD
MRPTNPLNTAKNLSLKNGKGIQQGLVDHKSPDRYYRLRLGQRSGLNIGLSRLKADANLALLDRSGNIISKSANLGRANESVTSTVDAGTYYVRVSRQRGKTHYRLKLITSASAAQTPPVQLPLSPLTGSGSFSDRVLALTNFYRSQSGLQPLQLNAKLTAAAQAHSQDMALNDFFSHTGSDGSTSSSRIQSTGYLYSAVGENIAEGYATPEEVVQAWMNSPGHRANILNPSLREMGVGFYFLESDPGAVQYHYYWTEDFGTQMNLF